MGTCTDRLSCDMPLKNSILYELLVYSEWKQEPELPKRPLHQDGFGLTLRKSLFFRSNHSRTEQIERLLSCQQPWRLCVGNGGKVVAIIQDNSLEIRSSRDEYSSVIAKTSLPKDPFPQWRKWCWSPDCSMLAVGFSNGSIRVYDLMGSNLFSIVKSNLPQEQSFTNTNHAFVSCFFLQARTSSQKWSSELVTVDYNGQLNSYLVSPTEGFQENHSYSFSSHYNFGITAVAYDAKHPLLFVAGPVDTKGALQPQVSGELAGLTTWRILNDHPFYQIVSHDKTCESVSFPSKFWRVPYFSSQQQASLVVRLEVSPSAKQVAALHSCGGVSIWSLPGIKLLGFWSLSDQPDWNAQNPMSLEAGSPNGKRATVNPTTASNELFQPVDLDWWSDEAIVLSRNSGSVSVCEILNLQNLLGESPEFLSGPAQVKRFHNEKGFLALECDLDIFCKSRNSEVTLEEDSIMDSSDDFEEDDEILGGLLQRFVSILKSAAYLVTDMERFRPRRRRLRLYRRTYRLLALRSTTPEELYSRKLDNEDYGDALTLAHTYNLDCDLVYQRQWRNSKVSVATIRDFLSKVTNQTWALKECLERIPESLLAARELIDFGLKATGRDVFKSCGPKRKVKDVEEMTMKQKELLSTRRTLLLYQDRLTIYEKILGGLQLADELFEHSVYADFRSSSSVRACVQFARSANYQAVECMLTYQGGQTLQHWLPILSNFPETVCPTDYKSLLPQLSSGGALIPWQESQLRELDWSEKEPYGSVKGLEPATPDMDNKLLYEHEPGLSAYRIAAKDLTSDLIQQWYLERVRAIERSSRMVDNALVLLRLAQDNNVKGLDNLYQELQILDALVYEIFLEDVSLADLEKKSPLEKCKLLMLKSTETTFVSDVGRLLIPYLDRLAKEIPGHKLSLFHDYLISIASENLSLPLKFFEGIDDTSLRFSPDEIATLAVECIYAYVGTDQLHLAQSILASIPVQRVLSESLIKKLEVLELELAACLILHRNHTPKPLGYLRDNKSDQSTVTQLLNRMARTVAHSNTPPAEDVWSNLLSDILDLQRSVFNCIPLQNCLEIFCSTLLSSGDEASIKMAGNHLHLTPQTSVENYMWDSEAQIPREKCIELVLSAAREYMDSAGSLTDSAMELARMCLYLLPIESEDIQEERNLLSSFQLLHEFGIKMLPLQVRLCPDRLRLIEECLKKKSNSHRNLGKLLQLAAFLNICCGNANERQGRVLMLVAEAAFAAKDFSSCAETCNFLVSANYTDGWLITSKLARCALFKNISTRSQLLSFSLQHCPSDMLQELVDVRRSLEKESLQQLVKKQIMMHNTNESVPKEEQNPSSQSDSLGLDFLQALQMGESSVQETTQRLLSCVGDTQFWKKALRIGWDENVENHSPETMYSPERQSCHAFYASLYDSTSYSLSKLGYQYDCFSTPDIPPQLLIEQSLLRISLIDQESGAVLPNLPCVLLECVLSLISEDNAFALGHLLSAPVSSAKEASQRILKVKLSAVTLQMTQYHAALRWYRSFVNSGFSKMNELFLYNPRELINFAGQAKYENDPWLLELQRLKAQLSDYIQAQDLLTLDCGVDINRFANDSQYRHDSILGLAMSEDSERLRFAVSLAARHGVDQSQVIAEHVAHLLLSDLPCADLKIRFLSSDLSHFMLEASTAVREKLEKFVYPSIEGNQISILELFYVVLNQVAPNCRSSRLLPKDHLKLLSKVKATTAAIDYKLLVSGPKFTLEAVEHAMTLENIPLVAKLLKAMPPALASPISMSELYANYLKHEILSTRNFDSSNKNLPEVLRHVKGEDIIHIIESIFFADCTTENFYSYKSAEEFIASALVSCEFSECEKGLEQLARWKDHIRNARWLLEEWPEEEHCRQFFATKGDSVAQRELLQTCFLDETLPAAFLLDLLKVISSTCCEPEEKLISNLLQNCLKPQPEGDRHLSDLCSAIHRLGHLAALGKLNGISGEVESLLRPLATDDNLPSKVRLNVFNILQQITPEPLQEPMLLLPHTQAIIASSWPDLPELTEDVMVEKTRAKLMLDLIEVADSWQRRDALRKVLDLWPSFSDMDCASKIYTKLLVNCILSENGKWTDQKASYIVDICHSHQLNLSIFEKILWEIEHKSEESSRKEEENDEDDNDDDDDDDDDSKHQVDVQLLILVCLLINDPKAGVKAVSLAQQRLMEPFHPKVAELALAQELTVDLLSTPAYSELLSNALTSDHLSAGRIVKSLVSKRHIPEAGAVILRSLHAVPRFMRTFSASLVAGLSESSCNLQENLSTDQSKKQSKSPEMAIQSQKAIDENLMAVNAWNEKNYWSDLEDTDSKQETPVDSVKNQQEGPLAQVSAAPKVDAWDSNDGWGDWSEDEVEKITSGGGTNKDNANRGQSPHQQKHVTPLLPSPQSAFARVPPREQTAASSVQSHSDSAPQPDDVTTGSSDWGDDDEWNTSWDK